MARRALSDLPKVPAGDVSDAAVPALRNMEAERLDVSDVLGAAQEQVEPWARRGSTVPVPALSGPDRELLNRLESQGVHFRGAGPNLPDDPGPEEAYVKTDDSGTDTPAGIYITSEVAQQGLSTTTEGTVRFRVSGTRNDGLTLQSESGLAEEVVDFGWADAGPDSFYVDLRDVANDPGSLTILIGADAASLRQVGYYPFLDDQTGGRWRGQSQLVERGNVVAGTTYRVQMVAQRAVFHAETVSWVRIDIAGMSGDDGEDGFSPVLAVVSANATAEDPMGNRKILKVVDWIESTGDLETNYSLFRGAYDSGVTYAEGDIVASGSEFYISVTSSNTGEALTDTDHWKTITAVGGGGGGGGLTAQQATNLIATWARATGATGEIPDASVPSTIARDSEIENAALKLNAGTRWEKSKLPTDTSYRTDATINSLADARIATWARATGATGQAPKTSLPSDITYSGDISAQLLPEVTSADSGQIAKVNASGAWALAADEQGSGGGGGLTTSQVDNRIATWARAVSPSGTIPDGSIPSTIARDTEVDAAEAADWAKNTGRSGRAPKDALPTDVSYRTDSDIDARIAAPARANSPSGTFDDARIPPEITRDDEVEDFALVSSSTATIPTARIRDAAVTRPKLATDQQIPALTGEGGKYLAVNAGATAIETVDAPSGGGGGLTQAQVDGRIATWARATNPSGTIPDARIPAGIARDTEVSTAIAGVFQAADWARRTGRTGRAPKAALPSDTSYRTAGQVNTLADARIATWARATSPSGTAPKARLPSDITYSGDISAQLLPEVTTANNGQIAKVAAGVWALGTDEQGSGGGGGLNQAAVDARIRALVPSRVRRTAQLASATNVTAQQSTFPTAWQDLATITISAAEAGELLIIGMAHGVTTETPTGNPRGFSEYRIRRTRGTQVLATFGVYGPRALASGFGISGPSQEVWGAVIFPDGAQANDVYTMQVRHAMDAFGIVIGYAADANNSIAIWRPGV